MPWGNKFPDMKNDPSYLEGRLSNAETSLAQMLKYDSISKYNNDLPTALSSASFVNIPDGTITVSSTVTVSSNKKIKGSGIDRTFISLNGNITLFDLTDQSSVEISDLTILVDATNTSDILLLKSNTKTMNAIKFKNIAIRTKDNSQGAFTGIKLNAVYGLYDCDFDTIRIDYCQTGISQLANVSSAWATFNKFNHITITSFSANAIYQDKTNGMQMSNNIFNNVKILDSVSSGTRTGITLAGYGCTYDNIQIFNDADGTAFNAIVNNNSNSNVIIGAIEGLIANDVYEGNFVKLKRIDRSTYHGAYSSYFVGSQMNNLMRNPFFLLNTKYWTLGSCTASIVADSTSPTGYKATITATANPANFYSSLMNVQAYRGRYITFSALVKSSKANNVHLVVDDGVGASSSYHPGDGNYHLLSVTLKVSSTATQALTIVKIEGVSGDTCDVQWSCCSIGTESPVSPINSPYIWKNMNEGTVSLVSTDTFTDIAHGMPTTPLASDIHITPTLWGSSNKYWITNITSGGFRLNVDVAPGTGGAGFSWKIKID